MDPEPTVHPETRARMVDVSDKATTVREAIAAATVVMSDETRALVLGRSLDKGDALEVARIAGIMGAKKTSELIPLCHPLPIDAIDVVFRESDRGIDVIATVRTQQRTGVEMEAMTAVATAALTIYDMVKGVERGVKVSSMRLLKKSGGRSGTWERPA
ncbi:MAG TPA: cyclic pyranopterin monophosphate synthase MoaC [Actinomycetota bacterium]|nr:cyclic pyranopterin monophosphate synthase MoaC [Actinomycetota bacterium]